MTKLELVKQISQRTGIERQDVVAVLESMMINVQDSVANGETIYLRGFGSFGNDPRKFYAIEPYFQFGAPRVIGISGRRIF